MAKKLRKRAALPKRVGGVKIPTTVRRGFKDLVGTQSGKVLAAEALLALGTALASTQAKHGSPTRRAMHDHDVGAGARHMAGAAVSTGSAMAYAIGEATRTFKDALVRGKAEAGARTAWPEEPEATKITRKNQRGDPRRTDLIPHRAKAALIVSAPQPHRGLGTWLAEKMLRRGARAEALAWRRMEHGPPGQAFRAFIQINVGQRSE